MAFDVRRDQRDKILGYLEGILGNDELVSLTVSRRAGRGQTFRPVGDPFTADELAALTTPESILEAILDHKCAGLGSWQLRAYHGTDPAGKLRSQPLCTFETISDHTSERGGRAAVGGENRDGALRDLAVQLRQNADMVSKRLDESMQRTGELSESMIRIVQESNAQERATQDESSGMVLNLSIQLVEARMQLRYAEQEMERVRADAASGVIAQIVDKIPPPAMEAAVIALVGLVGSLGSAAVDAIKRPRVAAPPEHRIEGGPHTDPAPHEQPTPEA